MPATIIEVDPKRDLAVRWAYALFKFNFIYQSQWLSPAAAEQINVSVSKLNLRGGPNQDGGPRFIDPLPHSQVIDFLDKARPWEARDLPLRPLSKAAIKDLTTDPCRFNCTFHESERIVRRLDLYAATETPDQNTNNPDRQKRPYYFLGNNWKQPFQPEDRWEIFWPSVSTKKQGHPWSCRLVVQPVDESLPHMTGLLADHTPFQGDTLKTGEISAAAGLIRMRRADPAHTMDRYVPATIFSCAAREVRVLQLWQDRTTPDHFFVRQSEIFNFNQGVDFDDSKANLKEWATLMAYFMGKPVVQI